ncbi:hypothetical protein HAX54_007329 [Datura stramonium]|uniref:Uncharacterized protein n=1 Tax=Datura stramonium TaxID=4076 RepID=A0ABS8TCV9_DATST|nr:hypothetical protein [Datura stramonium]
MKEEDWGSCLVAETGVVNAMTSINYERDWIMNSGSDTIVHHVEKEVNFVINKKQEDSDNVQTGDVVTAIKEIKESNLEIDNISLDTENVEVEPEEAMSKNVYVNCDHFEGNIEGDAEEVEISSQSSAISKTTTDLKQILKVDEEAQYQIDEEALKPPIYRGGEKEIWWWI